MRDKYTFKEITYNETKDIILNYHYAQRMPSISYAFGCYEGDELFANDFDSYEDEKKLFRKKFKDIDYRDFILYQNSDYFGATIEEHEVE